MTSAQNEKIWTCVFQITCCIPSICHINCPMFFSRPDPITSSSQTPKGHLLPLPRRGLRPRRAKQHQSDAGQSVDCHKPMPEKICFKHQCLVRSLPHKRILMLLFLGGRFLIRSSFHPSNSTATVCFPSKKLRTCIPNNGDRFPTV